MSRVEVIRDLAGQWMQKAENDLLTAQRELSFCDPVTSAVCFHCQQGAEKYLKGFLVLHQVYFGKTHRIVDLLQLCATIDSSFGDELEETDALTDYAVDIRYPDIRPEPELEEAREAFRMALKVKAFVVRKADQSSTDV